MKLSNLPIRWYQGKDNNEPSDNTEGKIVLRIACLLVLNILFLSACGGGGSASSDPKTTPGNPVTPTPPPSTGNAKPAPKGVFNSAGISNVNTSATLVSDSINSLTHVSGTLVRISWSDVSPTDGEYDFSAIETELEKAESLGDYINLAVVDGKELPEWLLNKCETFDFLFRQDPETTCLPWDATYLAYKEALISELGNQFDSHENLAGIYITYAAMTNGVEMHWRVDEQEFTDAGYTFEKLSDTYNTITDWYATYFPTTAVIMEVHTVFGSPALAQTAYDYCFDSIGERCGVAIWWCASRMATDPREMEYSVFSVAQQAANNSFAVCQAIASMTDEPERFDQGQGLTTEEVFRNEMEFFVDAGFKNFELWTSDIQNEALAEILIEEFLPEIEE